MSPLTARWVLVTTLLASALFILFPGLDLWASGLAHEAFGGRFMRSDGAVRDLRQLGQIAVAAVAASVVVAVLLKLAWPHRRLLLDGRAGLFLASSLVLGPWMVTNLILKDQWGRPRPWMIESFGGDLEFQPAWLISDQCDHNCSFVSGETSGAFWLLALAALAPAVWRPLAYAAVCAFAVTMGAYRVLAGGHFLSDVLLAGLLTYLCLWLVHHALYVRDPVWSRSARIECALGCAGTWLRRRAAAVRRLGGRRLRARSVTG